MLKDLVNRLFSRKPAVPPVPGSQSIESLSRELAIPSLKWRYKFTKPGSESTHITWVKRNGYLLSLTFYKCKMDGRTPLGHGAFSLTVNFSEISDGRSHHLSINYRETSPGYFERGNTSMCVNGLGNIILPPEGKYKPSIDAVVRKIKEDITQMSPAALGSAPKMQGMG